MNDGKRIAFAVPIKKREREKKKHRTEFPTPGSWGLTTKSVFSTSSSQPLGHDNAQLIGYYLLFKSLPNSLMDNSDSSKDFKRREIITFVSLLAQNNRIPQQSWREEEAEIQLLDRNLVILVFL